VVNITVEEGEDGVFRFTGEGPSWPAGTKRLAEELDRAGVPVDYGEVKLRKEYADLLKQLSEAGSKTGAQYLRAAIKYRKEAVDNLWISGSQVRRIEADAPPSTPTPTHQPTHPDTVNEYGPTHQPTHPDAPTTVTASDCVTPWGDAVPTDPANAAVEPDHETEEHPYL
jgi:predicted DNA-binding protein